MVELKLALVNSHSWIQVSVRLTVVLKHLFHRSQHLLEPHPARLCSQQLARVLLGLAMAIFVHLLAAQPAVHLLYTVNRPEMRA